MGPSIPEDFESFWLEAAREAHELPLDFHRSVRNDFDYPGFTVETLHFASVQDRRVAGWIAYPEGARRLPGFVWIPPYGRESLLPNKYGTREGFVSLSLNFHGHESFHQEKYVPARGYFAEGAQDPETWIFRRMLQDVLVAIRVLQAQVEADAERLGAMGMSQGGGLALWAGAWSPIIRAVCADMPFLGDVANSLETNVYRYPLKELVDFADSVPLGRARIQNTLAYFDTVTQAHFCRKPTLVSLGLRDPACKPDTVRMIFDGLPNRKVLKTYDWGHDWHPDMVENNRTWLLENLN